MPKEASALITKTTGELNAKAVIGSGALWAALSAAWATLNGTWAMIVGLNRAYEVKEERRWWRILTIAFGLTISLGLMGLMALGAMLYGSRAGTTISQHLGVHTLSPFHWRVIQWPVIIADRVATSAMKPSATNGAPNQIRFCIVGKVYMSWRKGAKWLLMTFCFYDARFAEPHSEANISRATGPGRDRFPENCHTLDAGIPASNPPPAPVANLAAVRSAPRRADAPSARCRQSIEAFLDNQ